MNAPALVNVNIPSLQMAEEELIRVLESSIYPGAKLESIKLVVGYCKANQLDPMTKPVHIVPMNVKKAGTKDEYVWRDVIMPGIELYRTKASRTGEYVGIDEAVFGPTITDDKDVGIAYPEWCSVTVYRLVVGERRSFSSGKVFWKETYATAGKDTKQPNAMWRKRPFGQHEKCSEAMALRRAFPEIGADPTREEMEGKVIEHDAIPAAPRIEDQTLVAESTTLPPYTDDQVKTNLPKWEKLMAERTKTAAQIVAMLQSKFTLSPDQIKAINEKEPKQ